MRLLAIIPLLCAPAAFVLSILCLFAGSKPGMLEDYDIVTLNTSTLGHVALFPSTTTTTTSAPATPTTPAQWLEGIIANVTSIVNNKTAELQGGLQQIQNEFADRLAKELGIQQWYSLHFMNMCEGTYTPSAKIPGAGKNVSFCTKPTAMFRFDPTAQIQSELTSRGLNISLATLRWPDEIQDGIDLLNNSFVAAFVVYIIAIVASGLCILTAVPALFLSASRLWTLLNGGLSLLAFFALAVASAITTVVSIQITNLINRYSDDISVVASKGGKFLALTWAAMAIMLVASVTWAVECVLARRESKRLYTEKTTKREVWGGPS